MLDEVPEKTAWHSPKCVLHHGHKKGRPVKDGLFYAVCDHGVGYFFRKLAKGEMARRLLTMPGMTSITRSISAAVL